VSVFVTLIVVLGSAFSTYLFTSTHTRSKEQGLFKRGAALCYTLSKAAEEGLLEENLSLIKKASYIIQSPDVTLVHVYSNIWEPLDAYPLGTWNTPPHPKAVGHFKGDHAPYQIQTADGYDFYSPILFQPFDDTPPTAIGFVRMTLSNAAYLRDARTIAVTNIAVSIIITLIAVFALNLLIRRLVVTPVTALHRSVSSFRNGVLPADMGVSRQSTDEIRELAAEFLHMCEAVRENEKKLIESDRRIRSLFERVEHAIFRTDENGAITEANGRFRNMFGGVAALCDILIGESSPTSCLRRAASEKALNIEETAIGRHGEELIISLSLYAEQDDTGAVAGYDGFIIDITDKKRLEERLMRSQKLEAVGTLAAGMAHDFNNLLTAILGYSGIMLMKVPEDDPLYRPISVINEAAKRGADLGRKILTLTRKEKMDARQVDLNDLLMHALDLLRTSFPADVELVTRLDSALPRTTADPSQLHQVIMNLAVNAKDAMPDGGRLTLETSIASPSNGINAFAPAAATGFIKFSVSDTGSGIDAGTQAKIFDPFFTTKEVGKGTGLGLYIVHSIVSNHGGYINVYSEQDQGTRFNIYLPVAKGAAEDVQREAADLGGTETILVIDDEPDVRELCKDMLCPLGYTLLLAENGSAGINLYRERGQEISLVILDMIMPRMGGNEVFHALRTINQNAKVLLYSGYSHNNFAGINQLLEHGAAGFVQKPFTLQDLGTAIRKALS
jgi:signal transduction histidine kinase/CheY-like chemotaxis protein